MIETKEALDNLDEIMSTDGLDGIYIGPADLSLAIGQKPAFDNPEGSATYEKIKTILDHAKKIIFLQEFIMQHPNTQKK